MADPTPAESPLREQIIETIREFPFDNYGLDDVSYLLEDTPDTQEWVPALADAVLTVVKQRVGNGQDGGES